MHFLLIPRRLPKPRLHHRTYLDVATINWVRDRALDHAVEKERDLKPILNLKNLIKSEPSKSIPLSLIAQHKASLSIPTRPIDFLRKYPSIFHEFFPGGVGIHPHVKLTPEVLDIDADEQVIYQTDSHKQDVADRLLKLLMISRVNKIPIRIIDCLKWDLGLPQDYAKSLIPDFPDYFHVTNGMEQYLELVCWSNELAVSEMEKKAMSGEKGYEKGMPLAFPLQYSRGFEIDKKFKKWVDEWQKLPYISPYENALQLQPKSDESDKWAVSLLHEILNLLIPKKTERDNLLSLGEYLGVRSRFKKALLQHPGIFYISSKIGTHTVVLREAYKRDLLLGKHHPFMGMRSSYTHLMYTVKDEKKSKNVKGDGIRLGKMKTDSREGEGENLEDNGIRDGQDGKDSEFEDVTEDDYDDDGEEEEEDGEGDSTRNSRGKTVRRTIFEGKRPSMSEKRGRRSSRDNEYDAKNDDEHDNTIMGGRRNRKVQFHEKTPHRTMGRNNSRNYDANDEGRNHGNTVGTRRSTTETRMDQRVGRKGGGIRERNQPIFRSREMPASQSSRERSEERSGVSRTRGRTNLDNNRSIQ